LCNYSILLNIYVSDMPLIRGIYADMHGNENILLSYVFGIGIYINGGFMF
jgi:hypothetical protein